MVTTIIETSTQTVTATEVKTSSKLITPSPTLDVVTVTMTQRNDLYFVATLSLYTLHSVLIIMLD